MSLYHCPECLAELVSASADLRCPACAAHYPVVDGLPLLCRQSDFYYGEVSRDVMDRLLARAREADWHRALLEHADAVDGMDFYDYASSDTRSGFKFLLDRFENGTVLDYGCGPGTITTSLARNFAHVFATDLTYERAQFTRLRATQEDLLNITVFCSGDTPHIPLPGKSMDLIILNGVLEWIPDFRPGEPRAIQIEFLKEMRRVLKDDGFLYVGIENRTGYGYFFGQKEEHTLLRFASLLPRRAADFYSRRARGKPFRTYTYTQNGYKALLAAAGLERTQFFGLLPNYREIEKAFRTSDRNMVRESLLGKRGGKRIRNALVRPIFPAIVGSYGILAANQPVRPYFERLVDHVSKTRLAGDRLEIPSYAVSHAGAVHLKITGRRGSYYLKLPLSSRMERRMARGVDGMRNLQALAGESADALLMPYPVTWDKYLGQAFLLEPLMPGEALDKMMPKMPLSASVPKLSAYLALLGKSTRRMGGTWAEVLANKAADYGMRLAESYQLRGLPDIQVGTKVRSIADYTGAAADGAQGFHCAIHGDFWHGNVLFDGKEMTLTAVMDWDFYEPQSLPFLDLFNLLVKDTQYFRNRGLGQTIIELHRRLAAQSAERARIEPYAAEMGVDSALAPLFLVVYWIRQSLLLLNVDLPKPASAYREAIGEPLNYFYEAATKQAAL